MSQLPIESMLRDAEAAWQIARGNGDHFYRTDLRGDLSCHIRALVAEVERLETVRPETEDDPIPELIRALVRLCYWSESHATETATQLGAAIEDARCAISRAAKTSVDPQDPELRRAQWLDRVVGRFEQ